MFELIINRADMYIILFCFLLGSLVYVINASGGAQAYGRWARKVIRSQRQASLLTALLGCLIFVDDYFNALTVGSVMKPVSDQYKVSRPKLAYLIDSTSAPICILIPISTWGAAVGGYMVDTGVFSSGISGFLAMVPYNLYALLCLIMVVIMCVFCWDFGPMYRFEQKARSGDLSAIASQSYEQEIEDNKAGLIDMVLPIVVLVAVSVLSMMYIGGFWSDDPAVAGKFGESLGNSVSGQALTWGSFAALLTAMLLYVPRKIMTYHEFLDGIIKGMEPMLVSGVILFLAWAIGAACVGIAGALMSEYYYIYPEVGSVFGNIAIVIVALGGFGSIPGAFIAGLLVGIIEVVCGFYISTAYKYVFVYIK